jgi:hypothetical protein
LKLSGKTQKTPGKAEASDRAYRRSRYAGRDVIFKDEMNRVIKIFGGFT